MRGPKAVQSALHDAAVSEEVTVLVIALLNSRSRPNTPTEARRRSLYRCTNQGVETAPKPHRRNSGRNVLRRGVRQFHEL